MLRERYRLQAKVQGVQRRGEGLGDDHRLRCRLAVMLLMFFTSPDYISLLWNEKLGNMMLIGSAIWMLLGILVMRKMINFDY